MNVLQTEMIWCLRGAVTTPRRSHREFAESDVVIPTGQFKGKHFSVARQPYTGLLFDCLDSGQWSEHVITGPSQSGKTLSAHVIPVLHRISEVRRNIVIAMPDMRMVNNKWETDFSPVFEASPALRPLLPTSGPGSRGGAIKDTITFTNGVVCKFMTCGGDDTARAGFTAEGGVFLTELAGFSDSGESSVEANPLKQIEARMRSLKRKDRFMVAEGTLTTPTELPWSLRANSTQSRILSGCPHCHHWISPEREHLLGWQDAESDIQAADNASFFCPHCGEAISDEERAKSLANCRLVHCGQTVNSDGVVIGAIPETTRLFFRWSGWHNLLLSAADLAVDEWKAAQIDAESNPRAKDDSEKELAQFVWCFPYEPKDVVIEGLTTADVDTRISERPRGELFEDTTHLALACDVGMYDLHWVLLSGREKKSLHVADYGTIPVLKRHAGDSSEERKQSLPIALAAALDSLKRRAVIGWLCGGTRRAPQRVWIDAGYQTDTVHQWIRSAGEEAIMACIGRGAGQIAGNHYSHPTKKNNDVREIGEQYHLRRHARFHSRYVILSSDFWKLAVLGALQVDLGDPGSLSLFLDQQTQHRTYKNHLTAEVVERKSGGAEKMVNPQGKANHYLDSTAYAFSAIHHAGFRIRDLSTESVAADKSQESSAWFSEAKRQ